MAPSCSSGSVSGAKSKSHHKARMHLCVCAGEWRRVKVKEEFSVFCSPSWTLYIAAIMSTNEANKLCSPRPPVLHRTTAPLCHTQCLSHDYTVTVSYLSRSSFWTFFFLLLSLRDIRVSLRGAQVCTWLQEESLAATNPHSCYWNLESIQLRIPPRSAVLLWNSVFSQGVPLCFPHPCVECQPQRNSNSGQKWLLAVLCDRLTGNSVYRATG